MCAVPACQIMNLSVYACVRYCVCVSVGGCAGVRGCVFV